MGCVTTNQNASKQGSGALIGAAGGALLGSQFGVCAPLAIKTIFCVIFLFVCH